MKKKLYLVAERGYGDGCDYTIGCNQRWEIQEFDGDLEAATKHFTRDLVQFEEEDYYVKEGRVPEFSQDHGVSEIVIVPLEFGFSEPDLESMRDETTARIQALIDAKKKVDSEQHDLKEFQRLQAKFGKK